MSVEVAAWAWKQKLGNPGLKLVLVKLADNADQDGYSWWKQERLADECEMSRATVQRKLKELRERGYLTVEERKNGQGFKVANGYRLCRPPLHQSDAALPHSRDAAAASTVMQQEPSKEPTTSPSSQNGLLPRSVGGTAVTAVEHEHASSLLDLFNELAGKSFSGKSWRESIIRRMREHPEVSLAEHQALVRFQFEHPWWKNEPTPGVIWGNDRVFDRTVNKVESDRKGRQTTITGYTGRNVLLDFLDEDDEASGEASETSG